MNKKKFIALLIFIVITSFSISVVAQEATSSSTTDEIDNNDSFKLSNDSNGETLEIDVDEVIEVQPEVESAPQWIIDKTNNFIISKVGKDYFAQHLQLNKSQTDVGGVKYLLTYIYTHNLKDQPNDIPYQAKHQFVIRTNSDGELMAYRGIKYKGPRKPYQFLISKSEAKTIAIQNGLEDPFEVSLYYGNFGYKSDIPIEEGTYVWLAWTKTCITEGNIEGLYIDVNTGNVISKKRSAEECILKIRIDEEEVVLPNQKEKLIGQEQKVEIEPPQKDEIKQRKSFLQKIIDWIRALFRR